MNINQTKKKLFKIFSTRQKKYTKIVYSWFDKTKKKICDTCFVNKFKIDRQYEFQKYKLNKNGFKLWALGYFLILGIMTVGVGYFLTPQIVDSIVPSLYFTEITILVTVLTIGFSFSIFLIQHASQNLPSGFYKLVSNYLLHDVIFFSSTFITLLLFAFALLHGSLGLGLSKWAVQLSLFLVGSSLFSMYYLFRNIREKIDPFNILREIQTNVFKYLDGLKKLATDYAKLIKLDPAYSKDLTDGALLAFVFNSFKPGFETVNTNIQYMFDYHDKVLNNKEKKLALYTLTNIGLVLQKYFEVRKDSSLMLPTGIMGRTSDSQHFLTPPLERFIATGKSYMQIFDNQGTTEVINVLTNITLSASQIKNTTGRKTENPVVEQCRGYLGMLMNTAIDLKHEEGLFQGTIAYQRIGLMAIENNLHLDISSTFSTLYKIGYASIIQKQEVVFGEVINSYNTLLTKLLSENYFNLDMTLKDLLENVNPLILMQFILVKSLNSSSNLLSTQTTLALPYKTMAQQLFIIARNCKKLKDKDLQRNQHTFIETAEQLRSALRYFSDNMQSADHLLVNEFASIIASVGCLLIALSKEDKWKSNSKKLISIAKWYAHQPYWFTQEVKQFESNSSFDNLVESVAQIGIMAVQNDKDDIALGAINDISLFTTFAMEKEKRPSYGLTEARIMELACHIGIVALKHKKTNIVEALKGKIEEFEAKYVKRWFPKNEDDKHSSIKKDQLLSEVLKLSNRSFQGRMDVMFLEQEERQFLQAIDQADISKFLKEVWKVTIK